MCSAGTINLRGIAALDHKRNEKHLSNNCNVPEGTSGACVPTPDDGSVATTQAVSSMHRRNTFQSDALGDTSAYEAQWGSRFHFMYQFTNDRKMWVEQFAQKMLWLSGISGGYNRVFGVKGATIQMYHSVSGHGDARWIDPRFTIPPDAFEAQMRFLSRHRNVVPYSALVDMVERHEDPPAGTVAITFDDGYLDTLRVAAPILEKYGLPAIAFLVTGYIDRGQTQWSDELFTLFVAHTRTSVKIPQVLPSTVDLNDADAKAAAYGALLSWFISALPAARTEMLAYLVEEFRPECMPPRLTMNWDEVRELTRKYPTIEIGVHSAEHLDMTAHEEAVAQNELDQCLRATHRELGLRPEHFAFPYNHMSTAARALVRKSGFRSAVASGHSFRISGKSDLLALPRMETCRSLSLFGLRTGGGEEAFRFRKSGSVPSPHPLQDRKDPSIVVQCAPMSTARVSAVIVSYNSADTVDASLSSVRKAHEAGFLDCLVVDNSSTDGTTAFIAETHPWVTLIESGENLGYGRGCNLALHRVRTPYVLFMNADAMIEPEDILTLIGFLESHPRAAMVAPALIETDGNLQGTRALPTPGSILAQAAGANGGRPSQRLIHPGGPPFEAEWLCGAVLLADRALLEELGGFDPRFFLYYEETDLCRRVRAHGRELWAVGTAVAKHAAHDSAAKTQKEMYEGCIAEYYFPSRFYYLAKQYGWATAAATEAGELALLAGRALIGRIVRRPNRRFAQRLRAPMFRAPEPGPMP